MSDIFDYMFLYLLTAFLGALKITGFITWNWEYVAAPTILALTLHCVIVIASRR
jgi:hypothetical protein